MARPLVVGTRGSRLALRQTEIALGVLAAATPGATFEVRTIQTTGDLSDAPLTEAGGRGVFVVEIERALLEGEIDIAVHSLKDLPSEETPGLTIAAVLEREDPRDVLVSRGGLTLSQLPAGAAVGTGSPRRAAQIKALRPDVTVKEIRGNVDTRIRKVEEGRYDAAVLAVAGLARLGWLERAAQVFTPGEMLPAVGQGALAVQVRTGDPAEAVANAADHPETRAAVTAERAFERRLGGGCSAAVAAYATVGRGPGPGRAPVLLRGLVGDASGRLVRGEMEGVAEEAEMLGLRLAEFLIAQGAEEMLA